MSGENFMVPSSKVMGLNPCFNGTYSMSPKSLTGLTNSSVWSLNPCFNGTYSMSLQPTHYRIHPDVVLILVLMEHTL